MKLMQFLMGLNDVFQSIRSSMLSGETLPAVKNAFAIISRQESHKRIACSSSGFVSKPQISGFVGHTIDRCFDLIGYPLGYNKNLVSKTNGFKIVNVNSASTSSENDATLSFINEQIMKLMNLINDLPSGNMQANMACNQTATCYVSKSLWHNRLGHPSDHGVDVLQSELNFTKDSHVSPCDICHKAK
ncbi:ribonuclease H-like domain-containing protein [Tanacetum coccineum]